MFPTLTDGIRMRGISKIEDKFSPSKAPMRFPGNRLLQQGFPAAKS